MLLRKLYLKIRLFLYSTRKSSNRLVLIIMITTCLYLFFNSVFFERFILAKASSNQINKNYSSAIAFYNIAYEYYKINHFSQTNKKIYLDISYNISICYLQENNKQKSIESMLNAIIAIQKQYGLVSEETAYFIKKYLIKYYLINNNPSLARNEFHNLLTIYKTIGFNNAIIFEMITLQGDLCYQQEKYDEAMNYYEKAYNSLPDIQDMDYDVFVKITDRICENEIKKNNTDKAIDIYIKSIDILKKSENQQPNLIANMLMSLGNVYSLNDEATKDAIKCYKEAIQIIKKLPKTNYQRQNINSYLTILKDLYSQDGDFAKVSEIDLEIARRRRFSFLF